MSVAHRQQLPQDTRQAQQGVQQSLPQAELNSEEPQAKPAKKGARAKEKGKAKAATQPKAPAAIPAVASTSALPLEEVRPYRSRKNRPCDFCRSRKSRCVVYNTDAPCYLCGLNGRACTFVGGTTNRTRPPKDGSANGGEKGVGKNVEGEGEGGARKRNADEGSSDEEEDGEKQGSLNGIHRPAALRKPKRKAAKLSAPREKRRGAAAGPLGLKSKSSNAALHELINIVVTGEEEEEEEEEDEYEEGGHARGTVDAGEATPFVMGSSSSADPVLQQAVHSFRHENGQYNDAPDAVEGSSTSSSRRKSFVQEKAGGEEAERPGSEQQSTTSHANGGSPGEVRAALSIDPLFPSDSKPPLPPVEVRRVTQDSSSRAVFFAFVENPYSRGDSEGNALGKEGYEKLKNALKGRRRHFMELYATRDAAAFPILSHSQRREYRKAIKAADEGNDPEIPLPTLLAHGSLATASVYEPSIRRIGKEAWADHLHALKMQFDFVSTLTLQVALTDLCGRPSINMSGNFKTMCQAYALAHMLGLHIDCSTWKFSKHERDLRIRIWWALYIHDKMSSLCWGKPSMIRQNDFSTSLPNRRNSPCAEHLEDEELLSYEFASTHEVRLGVHAPGDTFVGLAKLTIILDEVLSEFHSASGYLQERDAFFVAKKVKAYMLELEDWKAALPLTLRDVFDDLPAPDKTSADTKAQAAWRVPGTSES